jgi:hypothetical protein
MECRAADETTFRYQYYPDIVRSPNRPWTVVVYAGTHDFLFAELCAVGPSFHQLPCNRFANMFWAWAAELSTVQQDAGLVFLVPLLWQQSCHRTKSKDN